MKFNTFALIGLLACISCSSPSEPVDSKTQTQGVGGAGGAVGVQTADGLELNEVYMHHLVGFVEAVNNTSSDIDLNDLTITIQKETEDGVVSTNSCALSGVLGAGEYLVVREDDAEYGDVNISCPDLGIQTVYRNSDLPPTWSVISIGSETITYPAYDGRPYGGEVCTTTGSEDPPSFCSIYKYSWMEICQPLTTTCEWNSTTYPPPTGFSFAARFIGDESVNWNMDNLSPGTSNN